MDKEDLKYLFPYYGTLLIVFGAIKQIVFYRLFDVEIMSFLDFTEILSLFLNDILLFVIILIIVNIGFFLLMSKKDEEKMTENYSKSYDEKNIFKRLLHYSGTGVNVVVLTITY